MYAVGESAAVRYSHPLVSTDIHRVGLVVASTQRKMNEAMLKPRSIIIHGEVAFL